jgi:UDP-N-acetylglucosamine 2-epimerase (non-hydrolysing)
MQKSRLESRSVDPAVNRLENRRSKIPARQKLRVLFIFGTRPEAIKLAPVIMELRKGENAITKVCVTAQHREMLDQVMGLFGIIPDHDLNLMKQNQTLPRLASSVLEGLEEVFQLEQPDWAAAALGAFYSRLKIGHVEAGLRSGDKWQPFPEEINRRITSVVADLHFAPTEQARQNLLREGIPDSRVVVTGNTVIDALHWIQAQPWDPLSLGEAGRFLLQEPSPKLILVTAHRRENFGEPIIRICAALRSLAERYGDGIRIFYPVHRNPNIWGPVHQLLGMIPNIILVPPIDYNSLIHLMKRSYIVMTDSGGIQEEAPALGIPALVFRDVTERPDGVDSGNVRLVGTDAEHILSEAVRLMKDCQAHRLMAQATDLYGDGHASARIASVLQDSEV